MSEMIETVHSKLDQILALLTAKQRSATFDTNYAGAPPPRPLLTEHHEKAAKLYGCSLTNKSTLRAVTRHAETLDGVPDLKTLLGLLEKIPDDASVERNGLCRYYVCDHKQSTAYFYFAHKAGLIETDPENSFKIKKVKTLPV